MHWKQVKVQIHQEGAGIFLRLGEFVCSSSSDTHVENRALSQVVLFLWHYSMRPAKKGGTMTIISMGDKWWNYFKIKAFS